MGKARAQPTFIATDVDGLGCIDQISQGCWQGRIIFGKPDSWLICFCTDLGMMTR